jgi:hypothetical protein
MLHSTLKLPDPNTTPRTWTLDQNIKKYLAGKDVYPGFPNTPDIVCYPGHELIIALNASLLAMGAPGLVDPSRKGEDLDLFQYASRAMTDPNIFASTIPQIGRFILYLWIVRQFIASGSKLWNIADLVFGIVEESQKFPPISCLALEVEWRLVREFVTFAGVLEEPELDLIPDFWIGGKKEDVIKHPGWKKRRRALGDDRAKLPYRLSWKKNGDFRFIIHAVPQGTALYRKLIVMLAVYEMQIANRISTFEGLWQKMRASHELKRKDIDQSLRTRMNWQRGQWPEAYLKDSRLHTTDMRLSMIQDWCVPEDREDMEKRARSIVRKFKRADGYGPGNTGRVEKEIEPETQALVRSLTPDLEKILEAGWPVCTLDGKTEYPKIISLARNGTLKRIEEKHLRFLKIGWETIKENDRLDLCAKIVAEYLEDKTGTRFALASIRKHINLSKKGEN